MPEEKKKAVKPYITVDELKEYGIGRAMYYKLVGDGTIPSIRVGRKYVVPRAAFRTWYESCGGKLEGTIHAA